MTELSALVIEPLGKRHDRAAFSCGLPELDRYLARQAGQDVRRRIARVFVCTAEGSDAVLGFYTLSALAIDLSSLPEELSRKLPRHPVPLRPYRSTCCRSVSRGVRVGSPASSRCDQANPGGQ